MPKIVKAPSKAFNTKYLLAISPTRAILRYSLILVIAFIILTKNLAQPHFHILL